MNMFEIAVAAKDSSVSDRARQFNSHLSSLLNYLAHDPSNELLMLEAFQCSLGASQWHHAIDILRKARQTSSDGHGWTLREGELMLAQGDKETAKGHFLAMLSTPDLNSSVVAVINYNLAYIYFELGEFVASHDVLRNLMTSQSIHDSASIWPLLQSLYLRVLHRLGHLEQALAWIKSVRDPSSLTADAYGIASLIAIDASDLDSARSWLNAISAQGNLSLEHMIAQSSLALADRDGVKAKHQAELALKNNPRDGRTWSALGFANMLNGVLPLARESFAVAVELMPFHIGTLLGSAWVDVLEGHFSVARSKFDEAIALDRNFADSHGGLAVVMVKLGDPVAAAVSVKVALKLDQSCVSAHYAEALLKGNDATAQMVQTITSKLGITRHH